MTGFGNRLSQGSSLLSAPTLLPVKVNNLTTNQTLNKWNSTLLDAIRPLDIFSKVERKLLSWIKMYWLRKMLPVVSALQSLPIHISKDPTELNWNIISQSHAAKVKSVGWKIEKGKFPTRVRLLDKMQKIDAAASPIFHENKEMVDPILHHRRIGRNFLTSLPRSIFN